MFCSSKPCNHPTPLTLPPLNFGFHPWNSWKMTKNEMKIFYNFLNMFLLHYSFCSLDLFSNSWFCNHLWLCSFNLVFHYPNLWLYLGHLLFYWWNRLHLLLFLNYMWFFLFMAPSFEILWFLCLYFLLLSCLSFEVLWFFSLHFLLLSCSVGPYFSLLIVVQCLCIG